MWSLNRINLLLSRSIYHQRFRLLLFLELTCEHASSSGPVRITRKHLFPSGSQFAAHSINFLTFDFDCRLTPSLHLLLLSSSALESRRLMLVILWLFCSDCFFEHRVFRSFVHQTLVLLRSNHHQHHLLLMIFRSNHTSFNNRLFDQFAIARLVR
jgi:hypothetical protein